MIQIAEKPYLKTYKFPLFSDAGIFTNLLYLIAIFIPFFMVFSVRSISSQYRKPSLDFYLSYNDTVQLSPAISYNYQYYIQIVTSKSIYTYTNLYTQTQRIQPPSISYIYEPKQAIHEFRVEWAKNADQKVKKITLIPYFTYNSANIAVTDALGFVHSQAHGNNMADVAITGYIAIQQGNGVALPPTTDLLAAYRYNIGQTTLALQNNYQAYLYSHSDYVGTNMQNTLLSLTCTLSNSDYFVKEESATVLGQLVWSFKQYFPVACVFFIIASSIIQLVFRENILYAAVLDQKRIKQ